MICGKLSFLAPWRIAAASLLAVGLAGLANCGAKVEVTSNPPTGTVRVSLSDPPSCRFPNGSFKHVYITIRSVHAHVSSTAGEMTGGWQELAPQLAAQPVQVDLLGLPSNGCALAMLGSNTSLPVGDYQQMRLILVSNSPGADTPTPASNACGNQGFNCVVLGDDSVHPLELSSQDLTGLKIPPGQVVGGPVRIAEGSNVDLNIDFNACASILQQGNGRFRLRPTLTAGQVRSISSGISGQVVDSMTMQPIPGGTAQVALEQPDSMGIDRIVMQAATDSNGDFNFCPVPMGMFDVVAAASGANNLGYAPAVLLNVSPGMSIRGIPMVAESATPPAGPGTIQGSATASMGMASMTTGANVDVALSALQAIAVGSGTRQITIPLLGNSTVNVSTASSAMCPAGANCADYMLLVPAQNPTVVTFSSSGITLSMPAAGDVLYAVEARAFAPMSGGAPICMPSTLMTDQDSTDTPLKVLGGMTATAKRLDFTSCTAPTP